jgi:hypothetical protein
VISGRRDAGRNLDAEWRGILILSPEHSRRRFTQPTGSEYLPSSMNPDKSHHPPSSRVAMPRALKSFLIRFNSIRFLSIPFNFAAGGRCAVDGGWGALPVPSFGPTQGDVRYLHRRGGETRRPKGTRRPKRIPNSLCLLSAVTQEQECRC